MIHRDLLFRPSIIVTRQRQKTSRSGGTNCNSNYRWFRCRLTKEDVRSSTLETSCRSCVYYGVVIMKQGCFRLLLVRGTIRSLDRREFGLGDKTKRCPLKYEKSLRVVSIYLILFPTRPCVHIQTTKGIV